MAPLNIIHRASLVLITTLALTIPILAKTTTSSVPAATLTPAINNKPDFSYDQLYKLNVNFWNNFLYPADVAEAQAINSTIFATDVKGRIDATRTFDGRELNTEYIFGLFANLAATSSSLSLLGVPISYEILKFSANKYVSSAATRVMFNISSLNLVVPIEIDTWIGWNSLGQMTQYDGTFKYWQWLQDYVVQTAMPLIGASTATQAVSTLTTVLASQICTTAQTYCNGTNTQYADFPTCYGYLTTQVRWGAAYEFGRNTLLCRMLHQNMVPYRPSVHCSHIGPTGGGMCTDDMTYVSTVEQEYFNISWIPEK